MKLVHNVTLELFVRPGETERALDILAPAPLSEIRAAQWRWHPTKEKTRVYELPKRGLLLIESMTEGEEGDIVVLQCRFSKQRDTETFLKKLHELPQEELEELKGNIDDHLDDDGNLILKLNRKAIELGLMRLGKGLLVRVNLAAFPKNEGTCRKAALAALSQ
jgi:RNA binding exosome subunit